MDGYLHRFFWINLAIRLNLLLSCDVLLYRTTHKGDAKCLQPNKKQRQPNKKRIAAPVGFVRGWQD
jgi:hypothetical protein